MTILLLPALMLVPASVSLAMGMGIFYATGSGDSTMMVEGSPDTASRLEMSGYGIVLDTNVGKDRIFNYRLELGAGSYGPKDSPYDGTILVHDLGFSLARSSAARLWMGPEVLMNFTDDRDSAESPKLFGLGMGLALGVNVNMGRHYSLSVKGAYVSQTLTGHMTIDGVRQDITTDDYYGYLGIALIYRYGEYF